MAFILLFAGFETNVNLIGNPAQRAELQAALARGDAGMLATAVEELLRSHGTVALATWGYLAATVNLGG